MTQLKFKVINELGDAMAFFETREEADEYADDCDANPETGHDPSTGGYRVEPTDSPLAKAADTLTRESPAS